MKNIPLIKPDIRVSTGEMATEILHYYLVTYFNNTHIRNMNVFFVNPVSTVKIRSYSVTENYFCYYSFIIVFFDFIYLMIPSKVSLLWRSGGACVVI
jgi:hypothetical protein